jgi:hypothetical protein
MQISKQLSFQYSWRIALLSLLTILMAGTALAVSSLELSPQRRGLAIAVLQPGQLYLLDGMRNELVQLDTTGKELRQSGGFGSAPGLMQDPAALLATGGELYTLDRGLARVQRYSRGLGLIWTIDLEQGLTDQNELYTHSLLAMLTNGQLLIGDSDSRTVLLYDGDAFRTELIISPTFTGYSLQELTALVSTAGLIHLYDSTARTLFSFDIWGELQQLQHIPEEKFQVMITDGEQLYLVGDQVVLELHTSNDTVIWHPAPWLPRNVTAAAAVAGFLFVLDSEGNRILWERF